VVVMAGIRAPQTFNFNLRSDFLLHYLADTVTLSDSYYIIVDYFITHIIGCNSITDIAADCRRRRAVDVGNVEEQ